MFHVNFNRKKAKLKQLLGIRARLVLLGVILVAPFMFERARSLEDARAQQMAQASEQFLELAGHSADTEREVISSVETLLKSAAYIRAGAGGIGRSCDMLRASLPSNLPWVRNVLMVGGDGRVQCSTNNTFVGTDVSDRAYIRRARATREIVFSDFTYVSSINTAVILAAYPVAAINKESDAVVVASLNLDWMSKLMDKLGARPGVSAALVDADGIVMAAPGEQAGLIGKSIDSIPLLASAAQAALNSDRDQGSLSFRAADGSRRVLSFARIAGTGSRLIASIDENKVTAAINRDIQAAYMQFGFIILSVLFGGLIAAQTLIIRPINLMAEMAKQFGQGNASARVVRSRLPDEFAPLARALNAMAAQLGERQRNLVESNDRLTVIASIDMLSGLANRRGFQNRLDFEWLRAEQQESTLSLLMIDVDHFKLYNDAHGHPEGDACLSRLGETLSAIAAATMGFAGRYGGEEFCLLLPNVDADRAREIGEMVRAAVHELALPHRTSNHQCVTVSVGVASTRPNPGQLPADLIEAADAALYAAKHRGRNTVVAHGFVRVADSGGIAMAS